MKGIKHSGESSKRTAEMKQQYSNKKGFASGGRVHAYPKMDDGAMSGPGRIEKVREYGGNAKKK